MLARLRLCYGSHILGLTIVASMHLLNIKKRLTGEKAPRCQPIKSNLVSTHAQVHVAAYPANQYEATYCGSKRWQHLQFYKEMWLMIMHGTRGLLRSHGRASMELIVTVCFHSWANGGMAKKRRNPRESDARGNETGRGARTLGSANPPSSTILLRLS